MLRKMRFLGAFATIGAMALFGFSTFNEATAASCVGSCGTLGPDGIVTSSPLGGTYNWVSTFGGLEDTGQISGVGGTNGSLLTTDLFSATSGEMLSFYFNYVTSDGSFYSDYAWAELVDPALAHVAWIFTARTQPVGNTSPGFELPVNDGTLEPLTSAIVPGGPVWSPLGEESSGECFDEGCGYTGWILSMYTVSTTGNYYLRFGVSNFDDDAFDSGLAIDGANIGGVPIPTVPLPATVWMLLTAIGATVGWRARRPFRS